MALEANAPRLGSFEASAVSCEARTSWFRFNAMARPIRIHEAVRSIWTAAADAPKSPWSAVACAGRASRLPDVK